MYDQHPEYKKKINELNRVSNIFQERKFSQKTKKKITFQVFSFNLYLENLRTLETVNLINYLVGGETSPERRKIIEKWNRLYDKDKEEERRKKEAAEAKINFILLQQKIQEELNKKKTVQDK